MKFTVRFACGCVRDVELFERGSALSRKIAWLEDQKCLACQRKSQKEDLRDADNTAREKFRLCELRGTPKQVAWATDIRAQFFNRVEMALGGRDDSFFKQACEYFAQESSAKFWIENRPHDELKRWAIAPDVVERELNKWMHDIINNFFVWDEEGEEIDDSQDEDYYD